MLTMRERLAVALIVVLLVVVGILGTIVGGL